jgi:hypothetical protein
MSGRFLVDFLKRVLRAHIILSVHSGRATKELFNQQRLLSLGKRKIRDERMVD